MKITKARNLFLLMTIAMIMGIAGFPNGSFSKGQAFTVYAEDTPSNPTKSGITEGSLAISYSTEHSCLYYTYLNDCSEIQIIGATIDPRDTTIKIPNDILPAGNRNGKTVPVTSIGEGAFKSQKTITEIEGGLNLKSIGNEAFYNCTSLNGTNFFCTYTGDYGKVEEIGNYAFYNCKKLQYFPRALRNVNLIGNYAFSGCDLSGNDHQTTIKLKNTERIGSNAFARSKVYQLDLTDTKLTRITEHAFSSCYNLSFITFPDSIERVELMAFYQCTSLRNLYFAEGLERICQNAFAGANNLSKIILPSTLTSIETGAFLDCYSLRWIALKNPNIALGGNAVGTSQGITIWGSGEGAKTYANANGYVYKNIDDAAAEVVKDGRFQSGYKKNIWGISNAGISWGKKVPGFDGKGYGFYYYLPDALSKYNCTIKTDKSIFSGICAGLASLSALAKNGQFNISDFTDDTYNTLNEFKTYSIGTQTNTDKLLKIFASLCWSQFNIENESYSGNKLSKEFIAQLDEMTYGGYAGVVSMNASNDNGHTVTCFGVEYRKNASDKNDAVWFKDQSMQQPYDARLLIYDNNLTEFNANNCIYIDTKDGSWKFPAQNYSSERDYKIHMIYEPNEMYVMKDKEVPFYMTSFSNLQEFIAALKTDINAYLNNN